MSSGQEDLLKKDKLPLKRTLKTKFRQHAYARKVLVTFMSYAHQNLCHVAMKKIISYCKTKHPTKEQVKKNKRKMSKWNYDNKSVYVRKDLAYK